VSAAAKRKAPRPADVGQAKPFIERAAAVMTQQKELGSDLTDICSQAKETAGLDPTMIRFAARESLMDKAKRQERDDKREQYLHAVGLAVAAVESGEVSVRKAAKLYSIGKTSVYKALGVRAVSADPETGELPRDMVEGDIGEWRPEGGDGRPGPRPLLPIAGAWHFITAPVLEQLAAEEAERAEKEAERERKRAERLALVERNRAIDADPLDFPPHLRRAPVPA